jgi:hypothetical protein
MFNLIMYNGVDWTSNRVTVPLGRLFEFTEPETSAQFRDEDGRPLLDRLASLPCLFCEEGTTDETAYVGRILQARSTGKEYVLDITLDPHVPELTNSMLHASRIDLGIHREFEFERNHWAVKSEDLYRFLFQTTRQRRQRPTVFQIPEHENIEPTLASAMMPFDAGFNDVYEAIQLASRNAGLTCRRADDIWENPAIIQDVVALIDRSRVVVCDCTGRNPNVFYEAGIAHTLGREVILITQNQHDIPFDLRHLRYISYLNNAEGRAALAHALQRKMQTLLGH